MRLFNSPELTTACVKNRYTGKNRSLIYVFILKQYLAVFSNIPGRTSKLIISNEVSGGKASRVRAGLFDVLDTPITRPHYLISLITADTLSVLC